MAVVIWLLFVTFGVSAQGNLVSYHHTAEDCTTAAQTIVEGSPRNVRGAMCVPVKVIS